MSERTPGPWRTDVDDQGSILSWHYICVDAPENIIARVGCEVDCYKANARLIAAAPDMLAALKGVIRIADRKTVEFDAARAAIAKAEGKATAADETEDR